MAATRILALLLSFSLPSQALAGGVAPVPVRVPVGGGANVAVAGAQVAGPGVYGAMTGSQMLPDPAKLTPTAFQTLELPLTVLPQIAKPSVVTAGPMVRTAAPKVQPSLSAPAAASTKAAPKLTPSGDKAVPEVRGVPVRALEPGKVPAGKSGGAISTIRRGIGQAGRMIRTVGKKAASLVSPKRQAHSAAPLGRIFDNAKAGTAAVSLGAQHQGRTPAAKSKAWPKVPKGLKSAQAEVARTAADVDRLIPSNPNSVNLIEALKRSIRRHGPITVVTYRDSMGQRFVGLDVSRNPSWVDNVPELEKHERVLIRKIMSRYQDVQVIVREAGKTPDLMVEGVITELKSTFSNKSFSRLVTKANRQVEDFNARHMLAEGDLAMDLRNHKQVPVAWVLYRLNAWASRVPYVALDRVWIYAGDGMKMFKKGPDGQFRLQEIHAPTASGLYARPAGRRRQVHKAQLLAKQGRLRPAQRILIDLEKQAPHPIETFDRVAQTREMLAGRRLLGRIRKIVDRYGDVAGAQRLWERFQSMHIPEASDAIRLDVERTLGGKTDAGSGTSPAEILRARGIEAVVTVHGGARVLSRADAKKAFGETLARVGRHPKTRAERRELARARYALSQARHYEEAERLGRMVVSRGKGRVAIVTDGGKGIMEAANRGAHEAGGPSVGYGLGVPGKERNTYISDGLSFEGLPASEKGVQSLSAGHVFFPGGFGTMDELFELLTRMRSGEIRRAPIFLVGNPGYWQKILDFDSFVELGLISRADLSLFRYVGSAEEAWNVIEADGKLALR